MFVSYNMDNFSLLDYQLVIICSSKDEEKSHMLSKLHVYRRDYTIPSDVTKYQQYLQLHFVTKEDFEYQTKGSVMASQEDHERCLCLF